MGNFGCPLCGLPMGNVVNMLTFIPSWCEKVQLDLLKLKSADLLDHFLYF
jgi:hypothetical protein